MRKQLMAERIASLEVAVIDLSATVHRVCGERDRAQQESLRAQHDLNAAWRKRRALEADMAVTRQHVDRLAVQVFEARIAVGATAKALGLAVPTRGARG